MSEHTITEEPQEAVETPEEDGTLTDAPEDVNDDQTGAEDETFPRSYVERLRSENAKYRQRAQRADELAERLHRELVARTGRLADPADLPYDDTHLDDPEALTAAVDALLEAKPHLASRKPSGAIGQGAVSVADGSVDLAGLLRSRA